MMSELPYLAVIEASGKDAQAFLHGQLSASIDTLAVGGSTFACLCQLQGRVVALLLVTRSEDRLRLACAAELADTVLTSLSRYVLRAKVQLQRVPELSACGVLAMSEGDAVVFSPLPGLAYAFGEGDSLGHQSFRAEELARGVAWLDAGTTETFLPQMLGYEEIGALSFRKGCFPGQEIIARTRYLGRLKQRAVVLELPPGTEWHTEAPLRLLGEAADAEAVLVDRAQRADGTQVALLVVRIAEPFEVTGLRIAEQEVQANGRWPEVSSKRRNPEPAQGSGLGSNQ